MSAPKTSRWLYVIVFLVLFAAAAYLLTREDQAGLYDIAR